MRDVIGYYGYTDGYGDSSKQACWNQAIYLYNQEIIGYLYRDNNTGIFYTTQSGSIQSENGTYITVITGSWTTSTYIEVVDQSNPTTTATPTTTISPTSTVSPTTSTTLSPTTTDPNVTTIAPTSTATPTTTMAGNYGLFAYKQIITIGGRTAKIEIWRKDWSGASVEIEALSGSPVLSSGGSGDDMFEPLVKSSLSFSIIDTNQFDYSIFYTPDATKFKVFYSMGGTTEWTGYLTPDSFVQSLYYKSDINLIARDNVGYLSQLIFDSTLITTTIGNLLNLAWAKIAFAMTVDYRTFKTSLIDVNVPAEATDLLDAVINLEPFAEQTWGEVVEQILTSIGCQFRYVGGNRYVLTDISNLYNVASQVTSSPFIFLEKSGVKELLPAWRDLRVVQDYEKNDDYYREYLDNRIYTFFENRTYYSVPGQPSSAYTIPVYKIFASSDWLTSIPTVNPANMRYCKPSNIYISGQSPQSVDAPSGVAPTVSYYLSLPDIQNLSKGNLVIRFKGSNTLFKPMIVRSQNTLVRWFPHDYTITLKVRCNVFFTPVGGVKQVLTNAGWSNWQGITETRFIQMNYDGSEAVLSTTSEVFKDIDLSITTPIIEGNGLLEIAFYPWFFAIRTGTAQEPFVSYDYFMELSDFRIESDTNYVEDIDKVITVNSNHNIKEQLDLTLGQVPTLQGGIKTFPRGIFKNDTYKTPLTHWRFGKDAGFQAYDLYDMVAYERIHHFKSSVVKLTGDIQRDITRSAIVGFNRYYNDGTKDYFLNSGSLRILDEVMSAELIEVTPYEDPILPTTTSGTTAAPTTTVSPTTSTTVSPTSTVSPTTSTTVAPTTTDPSVTTIAPTTSTTLAPTTSTTLSPTTVAPTTSTTTSTTLSPTTTQGRTQVAYYGYSDFTGTKQTAYNSGSPLFDVMGYIYEFGGSYYANPTGSEQPTDGYYLTVVGSTWQEVDGSEYVTIGTPPEPTTTVSPTTTTTTTLAPTTLSPTTSTTLSPTTTSETTLAPTTLTPTTSTTIAPTTTVEQRQETLYYGYDANNVSSCFTSGLTGSIWAVNAQSLFYTTQTGDQIVSDGYYMTVQGSGVEDSEFYYIINGYIQ